LTTTIKRNAIEIKTLVDVCYRQRWLLLWSNGDGGGGRRRRHEQMSGASGSRAELLVGGWKSANEERERARASNVRSYMEIR
jgi:hypothetical protein